MSVVWWIALHGLALIGLLSLLSLAPKAAALKQAQNHNARMARIVQLEIANGYGIDYGRDWYEKQPERGKNLEYHGIARLHCYGCGVTFDGNFSSERRLCPKCRTKTAPRSLA